MPLAQVFGMGGYQNPSAVRRIQECFEPPHFRKLLEVAVDIC